MTQTAAGSKKAVKKIYATFGKDHFKKIGAKGGRKSRGGGFSYMKRNGQVDKIRAAGKVGGKISRRGKNKPKETFFIEDNTPTEFIDSHLDKGHFWDRWFK